MSHLDKYASEIGIIVSEAEAKLVTLGAKVREEVIIPICRKRNLSFLQGMGTFFFSKEGPAKRGDLLFDTIGDEDDAQRLGYRQLIPILKLLNETVYDNQVLGYYVGDYKPE